MSMIFTDKELDTFVRRQLDSMDFNEEHPEIKKTWTKSLKRAWGLWHNVFIQNNDGEVRIYDQDGIADNTPYLACEDDIEKLPRALVVAWLKSTGAI